MICDVCGNNINDPRWNQRYCSYRCQDRAHSIIYHKVRLSSEELVLKNKLRLL
jgi:predicted nucleic acid-binding Zn ribbon protein